MPPMWRVVCLLALLGCAPSRPALRAERLDFNGVRASWRPFTDAAVCDAEPRFLLDELLSVNEVLKRFLRDTAGDATASWPDAQVTLVDEGRATLPRVMTEHERTLGLVARCEFADRAGYPVVLERGRELLADTRRRLEEAPAVIAEVKRRRALEAWQQQRLSSQDAARRTCPAARLGAAVVYFAFRDEAGLTSFLFCDGAAVTSRAGEAPRVEPAPLELTRGRRIGEKVYLAAAARFPAEAILAPPPEAVSHRAP